MAMGDPVILQVVGYQNSGKTHLTCTLVEEATKLGLRVGTLKHHGHSGEPLTKVSQKDSSKHFEAGAKVSAVEGEGELHLTARLDDQAASHFLTLYKQMNIELILIEGYKTWNYPKVVMIRDKKDESLISELNHVIAVICASEDSIHTDTPVFLRQLERDYVPWLIDYIRGKHHHE